MVEGQREALREAQIALAEAARALDVAAREIALAASRAERVVLGIHAQRPPNYAYAVPADLALSVACEFATQVGTRGAEVRDWATSLDNVLTPAES